MRSRSRGRLVFVLAAPLTIALIAIPAVWMGPIHPTAEALLTDQNGAIAAEPDRTASSVINRSSRDGLLPDGRIRGSLVTAVKQMHALDTVGSAWQFRGPGEIDTAQGGPERVPWLHSSGRVLDLAYAPPDAVENNDKLYAATADGGVWRSTDLGNTWSPMSDHMPSLAIGAIAVHPTSPRAVFAGTGEPADCATFSVNATDCGPLMYGVGILKSLNAGHSWTLQGSSVFRGSAVTDIVINPAGTNTNHLFASTVARSVPGRAGGTQGVAISHNLGTTWSYPAPDPNAAPGPIVNVLTSLTGLPVTDLLNDHSGHLYAAVGNYSQTGCGGPPADTRCGIWISWDEAATWHRANTNLPAAGGQVYKLALAPSTAGLALGSQTLYLAVTNAAGYTLLGMYRTTNGGREHLGMSTTWTQIDGAGTLSAANEDQADYDLYVGVDPGNANTVYVGIINVFRTTDAGSTWTNLTHVYAATADPVTVAQMTIHPDQHAILFVHSGTPAARIFFGNDGGIYRSTDNGATFRNANGTPDASGQGGLGLTQFYGGALLPAVPPAASRILAGSQDNGTLQTPAANSVIWNQVLRGDGVNTAIDPDNPTDWYAERFSGNSLRSTDSGGTWTSSAPVVPATDRSIFAAPLILDPRTRAGAPATLYSGHGQLYQTTTGMAPGPGAPPGPAWTAIGPITCGITAIGDAPNDPNTIYISEIWDNRPPPAVGPDCKPAGTNAGRVWVLNFAGGAWIATQRTTPPGIVPGSFVTSLAVDPTNPLIVYATVNGFQGAQRQHVFRSNDGATTWNDISTSLPDIPFQSVAVNPVARTLIYAGADIGVYVSGDSGTTWHVLGTTLPNVPVYQLVPNRTGSELTAFTFGRGAWQAPDARCGLALIRGAAAQCTPWKKVKSMPTTREYGTTTLLADGRVLVAGGITKTCGCIEDTTSSLIYDPAKDTWAPTGSLKDSRTGAASVLLSDGNVLTAGGTSYAISGDRSSAERWNPKTGKWTSAGSLTDARSNFEAVLLPDGTALFIGGSCACDTGELKTVERYDPKHNSWSSAASMLVQRQGFTATRLDDGRVLVAGGCCGSNPPKLSEAEIYDPLANTWTATGSMTIPRFLATATLLADGRVLVAGGISSDQNDNNILVASAEIYDPATGKWTAVGDMATKRDFASAIRLPNGDVLVFGGESETDFFLQSAEVYVPSEKKWVSAGHLTDGRSSPTSVLLPDGTVLVLGGTGRHGLLASVERYSPPELAPPGSPTILSQAATHRRLNR